MIQFIKCSPQADAIQVMNKVNRYVEASGTIEGELMVYIPDINDEIQAVRERAEIRRLVYTYPEIGGERKIKVLFKRVIRKLTWWMFEHVFQQQNEFNGLLLQYVDLIKEKQNILERALEELYIQKGKEGECKSYGKNKEN